MADYDNMYKVHKTLKQVGTVTFLLIHNLDSSFPNINFVKIAIRKKSVWLLKYESFIYFFMRYG